MGEVSFTFPDLIQKKRDGEELTESEIKFVVRAVTERLAEDAQIGAFLMAVYFRSMSVAETTALTRAMMQSGSVLTWPESWITVDKHSTGGVGDKTSLPLAAALAVYGLKVPMISGRALGHTGGTLDKLESIPGFSVQQSLSAMHDILNSVGCFIVGQTSDVCPADKVLYAIRDVTHTVASLPLMCSSILCKKAAESLNSLILDVKIGSAAFLPDIKEARKLAEIMVSVGNGMGIKTLAVLSDMNNPLGRYIGNSLEVAESFECMKGRGCRVLVQLIVELGGKLLRVSGKAASEEEGNEMIRRSLNNGSALDKFCSMLCAQGVSQDVANKLKSAGSTEETLDILPRSGHRTKIPALQAGYVKSIDALKCGKVSNILGAGRTKAGMSIDHAVGLELNVDIGQFIDKGDSWVTVHHNKPPTEATVELLQSALELSVTAVPALQSLIIDTVALDCNSNSLTKE